MEQVVFQIIGVVATIGLLGFGLSKLFSYIRSRMVWGNPIKRYIQEIVLEYLRELSKDENDS